MPGPVSPQQLMEAIHDMEVFIVSQRNLHGYRVGFSVLPDTYAVYVTIPSTATVEEVRCISQYAELGTVPIRFRTEIELTSEQIINYLEGRNVSMPMRAP